MCVQDEDQVGDGTEKSEIYSLNSQRDRRVSNSYPLEGICENTVVMDSKQSQPLNFAPTIRSGEWSYIGGRPYMEDTHICITDLAKKFGCNFLDREAVSFYGVFDGHEGKGAALFVRENLPRAIVEDADFPLQLEKVVRRSFVQTDANMCSLTSGTTALTAIISGRSLLVANAGDCRAVLSRLGVAIQMSRDHKPCCSTERSRIQLLGGSIEGGYLNGQLGVTRALGDWHIEGMKSQGGGPLSAEPELKLTTLTKDDEFLIIGSDGIWDVFSNQNAVDFARTRLRTHNNAKTCCKEIVEEATRRGASDNLTVVMICFHLDPPAQLAVNRGLSKRSISAEGIQRIRYNLGEDQ